MLQSRNTEINKLFAMHGHESSERMECSTTKMENVTNSMYSIAKSTERDTASMHIITFFTLVFLPGTFLGVRIIVPRFSKLLNAALIRNQSFFSTPIINSGDAGSSKPWTFNPELFRIFIEICIPLMIITIGIWLIYLHQKSRRDAQQERSARQIC
jgi:hypothetical protein